MLGKEFRQQKDLFRTISGNYTKKLENRKKN